MNPARPNVRTFGASGVVLTVLLALGCTESGDVGQPFGVELPVHQASTLGTLVFNTQFHPPDPCVEFVPGRDYGHVQLLLDARIDGSWDATWKGVVAGEGLVPPLTGELRDLGGEGLGSFSVVENGGQWLDIVGAEIFGDGTATAMADAPEEYVVEILDGGVVVLEGNFGIHPPDPCAF